MSDSYSGTFELGPLQKNWLEALKSGKYKQVKGRMKDKIGNCCLGVIGEIEDVEWCDLGKYFAIKTTHGNSGGYLPLGLSDKYGIIGVDGEFTSQDYFVTHNGSFLRSLAEVNDTLCNGDFGPVVEIIEEHPEWVFTKSC